MLKSLPFIGNFPISQKFGENPEFYQNVICAGAPMRGHNGIDYATPIGTPVVAVQNGVVLESQNDPAGFGEFILLGHPWGQSLYAHLEQRIVQQGQHVSAGQHIGLTGSSGLSTGPHLHFAMRIAPYSVQDGWCGYSDPMPYLERIRKPRGAIIGAHIIAGVSSRLEVLSRWQPRLVVVLDPNPDEMRALRQACPNTVTIGRVYEEDSIINSRIRANPREAARWAHDKTLARMSPDVDYWQFANEVLQSAADLPLLNEFELERMALAEQEPAGRSYKCAILAFSVGNPDLPEDDRMALWRLVYPAIEHAEKQGHVVAVHQYGAPDLWGPEQAYDWYIHRLEHQVLRRLPYKKVQFAVTEFGIDGGLQGLHQGWQGFTNAEGYTGQLLKAGRYLERFSGRVLGYSAFTLGHYHPWGSYDIAGRVAELLAEGSLRGTWSQVGEVGVGVEVGETDTTTDPGGETPGGQEPGEEEPTEPEEGEPGDGETSPPVVIERRLSDRFEAHHMSIKQLHERPDKPGGEIVYVVKDVFTTRNGSWELSSEPGAVPQWARDAYLKPEFLEAGADHHLFAAIIGLDGQFLKNHEIIYWSDGFDKLGDANYTGFVREKTKTSSGWANLFITGGSSFAPDRGESGPWCWMPAGAAEVICGGGLPLNHHISTFVVWQAVRREDLITEPGEGEPGEEQPGEEQPDEGEPDEGGETSPTLPVIQRRVSQWATHFNMGVKALAERPDHPQGDTIYLIKDIFTTRDGSWEPSDVPGSLPQWARDAYLKPLGAPDYFDDAGGDHHLFAAVIGLDGQLIRDQEIVYWSDGFDKLGDPNYTGYIFRKTKTRSGWANIISGSGSSFVPERGESGPWCWAPTGAAEVICGGGMPANWHVSMFVVWQAFKREEGGDKPPGEDDYTIFLPFVSGGVVAPAQASALDNSLWMRLRRAVWGRLGAEFNPDSVLAIYARGVGLGMPVTPELTVDDHLVQGFHGGVVFVRKGEWKRVRHIDW